MMPGLWLAGTLLYLGVGGLVYALYIAFKLLVILGAHSAWRWDEPLYRVRALRPLMWVLERTISTPATHWVHHAITLRESLLGVDAQLVHDAAAERARESADGPSTRPRILRALRGGIRSIIAVLAAPKVAWQLGTGCSGGSLAALLGWRRSRLSLSRAVLGLGGWRFFAGWFSTSRDASATLLRLAGLPAWCQSAGARTSSAR
jgi:hypothetical protein